jgi:hypothetical protein
MPSGLRDHRSAVPRAALHRSTARATALSPSGWACGPRRLPYVAVAHACTNALVYADLLSSEGGVDLSPYVSCVLGQPEANFALETVKWVFLAFATLVPTLASLADYPREGPHAF